MALRGPRLGRIPKVSAGSAIANRVAGHRHNVTAHTSERKDPLGDKQAAKARRRDNREQREREKAARTGDSPAQKAEQTRRRDEAAAERNPKSRSGGGEAA